MALPLVAVAVETLAPIILKELLKGDDEDDGKGNLPPSPRSPRELNQ